MFRLRAALVVPGVLSVLLAPVVATGQSDPALWRFVYPNAKALISIDWARIRQSPAGVMIREKWLAPGALPAIPAMELLNDVDRVLISSPGKTNDDDDAGESPILVAIHGHFDAAQVHQVFTRLGAKPQSYNSFQVYRPQGKNAKDTAWVFFDAATILYGDAPSIFSALDRSRFMSPPLETGSLVARATELDANYELWVILDASEIMASDQVAALFQGGEWASEAQGFEAGVHLRAGLAADITVRFSSDDTARRVTAELTRVMSVAAKDRSASGPVPDLAKKLKFNLDGSATKISLRLNERDLERSAEAFRAGYKASVEAENTGTASAPPPASAMPPKPVSLKPAVIRIEGLDGGPREIPYPEPQQ
jgi:hypothetical protein